MSKKRKNVIMLLGILSVMFITTGLALTVYSYTKDGVTENSIKSGSITFWYDEQKRQGNSIGIEDALPISDTDGKQQTNAFNFRITSKTSSSISIPYKITLRQKSGTDNIGNIVKVYLAKTTGIDAAVNTENEVVTSLFSSLENTTHNGYSEKILWEDEVPINSSNYIQNYRLKMWIDNNTDYSNSNYTNKTFTVTVNVYSEGKTVSSNQGFNLRERILDDYSSTKNTVIPAAQFVDKASDESDPPYQNGLFKAVDTNGGDTYYFRGNIDNYLKIGNDLWRIIRINEDGTIRIITENPIEYNSEEWFRFNDNYSGFDDMYYSSGTDVGNDYDLKTINERWYHDNIENNDSYKNIVTTGTFCQAMKVTNDDTFDPGNANPSYINTYSPSFSCPDNDGNYEGKLTLSVGLMSMDELIYSGVSNNIGYHNYLGYNSWWWTMSPVGVDIEAYVWTMGVTINNGNGFGYWYLGGLGNPEDAKFQLRPVINIKADTMATIQHDNTLDKDIYVVQ